MKYGAKGAIWAQIETAATTTAKPAYGETMKFTGLNTSEDTLSMATGSAYGDNMEMIYLSEFSNGEINVQAVQIEPTIYAAVLGTATDESDGLTYGSEDNQPFGAYGFYCNKMYADKTKYYEVIFYPKVQGSPDGNTSKTKEDNITLEYETIKFRMLASEYMNAYKITKQFNTEAEAQSYLAGLFAGTSDWPETASA